VRKSLKVKKLAEMASDEWRRAKGMISRPLILADKRGLLNGWKSGRGRWRVMVCGKASELPNQIRGGFATLIYHKVTLCQELLVSD